MKRKFCLGGVHATPSALKRLSIEELTEALDRHGSGDWGDCCPADKEENELSLREGYRLFSVYRGKDGLKFWIITEADRSATTILLPQDY